MNKEEKALEFLRAAGMDDVVDALDGHYIGPETGLNRLAAEIHQTAKEHGWYDTKRELPECIALMHSELSEALEAYRDGEPLMYCGSKNKACEDKDAVKIKIGGKEYFTPCVICDAPDKKPEGVAVELADCIIRILDTCAFMGIDIERAIRAKMEYNRTRPYRHGGKKC